jgi:hypothetical protein
MTWVTWARSGREVAVLSTRSCLTTIAFGHLIAIRWLAVSGLSRSWISPVVPAEQNWFVHPDRLPRNVEGPFYTTGTRGKDGTWCGDCLACELPEGEAPDLLAPLRDGNLDTYFVKQPETPEEIERACSALRVCCTDALRYGGKDPRIIQRLPASLCDYRVNLLGRVVRHRPPWWAFWR